MLTHQPMTARLAGQPLMFRAAFFKGTRPGLAGLYNRLVRWWTRGKYSHCELVFSDGWSVSSSFIDGGVRFKKIDFNPNKWDFVELPDSMEDAAKVFAVAHVGKAYDYWMNVRFAFGFIPESPDKWSCSEFMMSAIGFNEGWRFEPNANYSVCEKSMGV